MNTLWVMEIGDWRLEIFNRERRNIVQNPKTLQYVFSISFYNTYKLATLSEIISLGIEHFQLCIDILLRKWTLV